MFDGTWVGPVLVIIGLIVVFAALEVVSVMIADIAETAYAAPGRERKKRAA
jgi:hypothetical protein